MYFELMCCQYIKKMYYNITQNSVTCALLSYMYDWQLQKFSEYILTLLIIVPAQIWFKSFLDLCCSDKLRQLMWNVLKKINSMLKSSPGYELGWFVIKSSDKPFWFYWILLKDQPCSYLGELFNIAVHYS